MLLCTCVGQRHPSDWPGSAVPPVGGAQEEGVSGHRDAANRLQGLQRENGRLQDQLKNSEELNATLRSELDLHRSIMAQTSSHHQGPDQDHDQEGSGPQTGAHKGDGDFTAENAAAQPCTMNSGKYSQC